MDKPSMEWIDNLFTCMNEFYGERWSRQFDKGLPESLSKIQWQAALQGLTYDEIKCTLVLLKRAAINIRSLPPNCLEFFRYAKDTTKIHINYARDIGKRGDPEIARRALDEIAAKLRGSMALK